MWNHSQFPYPGTCLQTNRPYPGLSSLILLRTTFWRQTGGGRTPGALVHHTERQRPGPFLPRRPPFPLPLHPAGIALGSARQAGRAPVLPCSAFSSSGWSGGGDGRARPGVGAGATGAATGRVRRMGWRGGRRRGWVGTHCARRRRAATCRPFRPSGRARGGTTRRCRVLVAVPRRAVAAHLPRRVHEEVLFHPLPPNPAFFPRPYPSLILG